MASCESSDSQVDLERLKRSVRVPLVNFLVQSPVFVYELFATIQLLIALGWTRIGSGLLYETTDLFYVHLVLATFAVMALTTLTSVYSSVVKYRAGQRWLSKLINEDMRDFSEKDHKIIKHAVQYRSYDRLMVLFQVCSIVRNIWTFWGESIDVNENLSNVLVVDTIIAVVMILGACLKIADEEQQLTEEDLLFEDPDENWQAAFREHFPVHIGHIVRRRHFDVVPKSEWCFIMFLNKSMAVLSHIIRWTLPRENCCCYIKSGFIWGILAFFLSIYAALVLLLYSFYCTLSYREVTESRVEEDREIEDPIPLNNQIVPKVEAANDKGNVCQKSRLTESGLERYGKVLDRRRRSLKGKTRQPSQSTPRGIVAKNSRLQGSRIRSSQQPHRERDGETGVAKRGRPVIPEVLSHNYVLSGELIGRGGLSDVYVAHTKEGVKNVAVKICKLKEEEIAEESKSVALLEYLQDEVSFLNELGGKRHVVEFHEAFVL